MITGAYINYFSLCYTRLWLFAQAIVIEQGSCLQTRNYDPFCAAHKYVFILYFCAFVIYILQIECCIICDYGKMINPFPVAAFIRPDSFCDRSAETKRLTAT